MDMRTTSIYEKNAAAWLNPDKRRACNEGGTSSSKTYSILQLLILIASHARKPFLISTVSESLPHLKRGCIRDFKAIMGDDFDDKRYNKTEQTYTFGKGVMEFFGADEAGKVKGPRRDILYINEANNVPWTVADGLDVRTRLFTFVDWNPTSEFWAYEYESGGKSIPGWMRWPDTAFIHSTYLDAKAVLPAEVITNIESKRDKDPNWWNIYGLGLLGKVEGLVYPVFTIEDKLPESGQEFYSLDYGFSTDPTVLLHNVIRGDELHSRQLIYETGLTNDDIAHRMADLGVIKHYDEIYDDAAEPKSNEEIARHGFNIKPAPKGPGSVEFGHQKVLQYKQFWTSDSLECIKEQRNFRYIEDKNGKLTDKTTHEFSHGMDARRYGVVGFAQVKANPLHIG